MGAMSLREWNAAAMVLGHLGLAGWVLVAACGGDAAGRSVAEVSGSVLWAIVAAVVYAIVANILVAVVTEVRHGRSIDEPEDERDRAIDLVGKRNAYLVLLTGTGLALLALALGVDAARGVYALFGTIVVAEIVHSGTKLHLYRVG